ncbi:MAG: D-alanine--D-alanine ligase, partial [Solirubrobacteraceae bacterium]
MLAGGLSSEHDVSLASATAVAAGLREAGHTVLWVEIGRDGRWMHEGCALSVTPGEGLLDADVVFPVLHGPFGEDGAVQGLLELLGAAYVGAGVSASAVCIDKVLFKDLMSAAGVPQVRYAGLRAGRHRADPAAALARLSALSMPVWVKPAHLGSSLGIVKVEQPGALEDALAEAFSHDELAIVEESAPGREVECGVLG